MQRTLVLMRHGHADEARDDFSRVLSERGRDAAEAAADALAERGFAPDRVLSSAAPRALETAEIVARRLGQKPVEALHELYLAPEARYLAVIRALGDDCRSVLVVGHNPDLSALARHHFRATGELAPAAYVSLTLELPSFRDFGARSKQA